jgi:hypothetical protein
LAQWWLTPKDTPININSFKKPEFGNGISTSDDYLFDKIFKF